MKGLIKKLFLVMVLSGVFCHVLGSKNIDAYTYGQEVSSRALGYTINLANSSKVDVTNENDAVCIIDDVKMSNWTLIKSDINKLVITKASGSSFENFSNSISVNLREQTGASFPVNGAKVAAAKEFKYTQEHQMEKAFNSSYYSQTTALTKYMLTLKNSGDYSFITSSLSNDYLSTLKRLNNSTYTEYKSFFERYGTHLITSAYFGGKLNVDSYSTSSTTAITDAISTGIKSEISGEIDKVGKASASFDTSLNARIESKYGVEKTNFAIEALGGNSFRCTDIESLQNEYNNWISSINDAGKQVFIGTPNNGLVALWNIVPSESEYTKVKANMKGYFERYVSELADALNEKTEYCFTEYLNNQIKVSQRRVEGIDLPVPYEVLKAKGFNRIGISFTLEIKEQDDGYQHLTLKNGNSNDVSEYIYEHGPGTCDKSWAEYGSTYYGELIAFNQSRINFVYAASGWMFNDWYKDHLTVDVRIYKAQNTVKPTC